MTAVQSVARFDEVMAQIPVIHERRIDKELTLGRYEGRGDAAAIPAHEASRAEVDAGSARLVEQVANRPETRAGVDRLLK